MNLTVNIQHKNKNNYLFTTLIITFKQMVHVNEIEHNFSCLQPVSDLFMDCQSESIYICIG